MAPQKTLIQLQKLKKNDLISEVQRAYNEAEKSAEMYAALKHGNLLKSIYLGCGAFIGALMIYFQFSERAEIGGEKFNLSISEPLFSILVIASIPWIGDIIKGWKK